MNGDWRLETKAGVLVIEQNGDGFNWQWFLHDGQTDSDIYYCDDFLTAVQEAEHCIPTKQPPVVSGPDVDEAILLLSQGLF